MILKESEPLAWTMSQDLNKRYPDQVSISGQLKRDLEATAVELANAKKNGAGLVEDARSKLAKFQTLVNRIPRCANWICTQRFRAEGGSTNYRDTPALRMQSMRSLALFTLTQDIIKERTDTIISEKRAKLARTHEQSSTKNDDLFLGPWREKDFIIK
jgi:hypothetical protein